MRGPPRGPTPTVSPTCQTQTHDRTLGSDRHRDRRSPPRPAGPHRPARGPVPHRARPGGGRPFPPGRHPLGVAVDRRDLSAPARRGRAGERCYDIEAAEALLLGHEGRLGRAPLRRRRPAPGCAARPVPPDPPAALRRARLAVLPLRAAVRHGHTRSRRSSQVYAEQLRRHDATAHPGRMRLLTAAESAGMLVAAEMHRAGLPWRADVHREVLHDLLGERYAGGGEPRRLAELADEVSAAFGRRVRPDLPADVVKAFAQAGIKVKSTRRWELRGARPSGGGAADRGTRSCTGSGPRTAGAGSRTGCGTAASAPSTCRAARSPAAGRPTAAARCRSPR